MAAKLKGNGASAPPGRRAARVGPLLTVGDVCTELARLYRAARQGKVSPADASRLAFVLTALRQSLEVATLEQRVASMERLVEGLDHGEENHPLPN